MASSDSERLRICYVLSRFHPHASGAERQALAQGAELVRRGHHVQVVTRHIPGLPRDETLQGVEIHRWVTTSNRGPLFGISFVHGVVRALRRLRSQYDLIHTHQGLWESISTGLARDLLTGKPVLVQPASAGYYGEAQEMTRTKGFAVLRRLALRNRHFAAISAEIDREWRALGVPAERIARMASGVDAERFHPAPDREPSAPPAQPKVVFTGRLHPQKNLDLALEIWPEVTRRTGARLILVGDGPERQRLAEKARALRIDSAVDFAGGVADPSDILRAADAFLLPSVAEGMSNSLLEAMATALPCLASEIGGNTDLIESGRNGLLIPPEDRAAWIAAVLQILTNRPIATAMGAAARARIESEFALPVIVDRYMELYRRLLAAPDADLVPSNRV